LQRAAGPYIGVSSAIRWVARFRQTGSSAAKPTGGKRSPLDEHKEWLLELIAAEPDLTLQEIRARLRTLGIIVAASSVWRFCERHDLTFKKKPARRRTGARGRAHGAHELEARAAAA
jgi:transposase